MTSEMSSLAEDDIDSDVSAPHEDYEEASRTPIAANGGDKSGLQRNSTPAQSPALSKSRSLGPSLTGSGNKGQLPSSESEEEDTSASDKGGYMNQGDESTFGKDGELHAKGQTKDSGSIKDELGSSATAHPKAASQPESPASNSPSGVPNPAEEMCRDEVEGKGSLGPQNGSEADMAIEENSAITDSSESNDDEAEASEKTDVHKQSPTASKGKPALEPKLFQLRQQKGKSPRLAPVDLGMASLNSGGSFIYERPGDLIVWTGKYVPMKMRHKLRKVMKRIGEARGGQPKITFLQEGDIDDATTSFYANLGAKKPTDVTISPPWPEVSQSEESGESGENSSGGEDPEGQGNDEQQPPGSESGFRTPRSKDSQEEPLGSKIPSSQGEANQKVQAPALHEGERQANEEPASDEVEQQENQAPTPNSGPQLGFQAHAPQEERLQEIQAPAVPQTKHPASPHAKHPESPVSQWSTSSPNARRTFGIHRTTASSPSHSCGSSEQVSRDEAAENGVPAFVKALSTLRRSRGSRSPPPQGEVTAPLKPVPHLPEVAQPTVPKNTVSIAPGNCTFPYEELKGMKADSGIDMTKKEEYMEPKEFTEVFGYPVEKFKKLPGWKQIAAKKEKGIF